MKFRWLLVEMEVYAVPGTTLRTSGADLGFPPSESESQKICPDPRKSFHGVFVSLPGSKPYR